MVKVVYNNGPRTTIDPTITIENAILLAVETRDPDSYCVFFNNQRIKNSVKINEIPGIDIDNHTLRIYVEPAIRNPKRGGDHTKLVALIMAFKRLSDEENSQLTSFVQSAEFRKFLLLKFPAIDIDPELLSVLADSQLTYSILMNQDQYYFRIHSLFVPALYAILDHVFDEDTMKRLLTTRYTPSDMFGSASLSDVLGFSLSRSTMAAPRQNNGESASRSSPITLEMFTNAMEAAGAMSVPANPAPQPEETYATQLANLHEYGFIDDQENLSALAEANGSLELALELIIRNREEES